MLFSRASIMLALTTVVTAAPLERRWEGPAWWKPSSDSSYLAFRKRYPDAGSNAPTCDLSSAVMPTAPTPLPSPAAGLTLSHVAIGRGTQNYTCDLTNPTAVPVGAGAVATLFNVSCLAADQPKLLSMVSSIALDLPLPSTDQEDSPAYQYMSGHHYFLDSKTPFFNMDTTRHQYGTGAFKKGSSTDAPSDATKGQYGQGSGSVAWLKLDAKDSDGQAFQEVYRVNTAGGQPPKTCAGMPAAFEVQYAAEYWLYAR